MAGDGRTEIDPEALDALRSRVGSWRQGSLDGRGLRVGLACGRFNGGVTQRLLAGALDGLDECGVDRADVVVAWVPGAFELPLVAAALLGESARPADAVVCLGAVIRGDTGHYDFVAGECAAGIQRVQLDRGRPVVFGVLTTDTVDQALERSRPDETNKGREAALTAVEMTGLLRATV
jgi:6,7-dimethyl-8-ribityllumazine synthase